MQSLVKVTVRDEKEEYPCLLGHYFPPICGSFMFIFFGYSDENEVQIPLLEQCMSPPPISEFSGSMLLNLPKLLPRLIIG